MLDSVLFEPSAYQPVGMCGVTPYMGPSPQPDKLLPTPSGLRLNELSRSHSPATGAVSWRGKGQAAPSSEQPIGRNSRLACDLRAHKLLLLVSLPLLLLLLLLLMLLLLLLLLLLLRNSHEFELCAEEVYTADAAALCRALAGAVPPGRAGACCRKRGSSPLLFSSLSGSVLLWPL